MLLFASNEISDVTRQYFSTGVVRVARQAGGVPPDERDVSLGRSVRWGRATLFRARGIRQMALAVAAAAYDTRRSPLLHRFLEAG